MKDINLPIVLLIYVVLTLAVMILYAVDKSKARRHRWRIPEATLLLAAVVSPIGALLGMYLFHHKTRKPKFFILVPLILIIECVIVFVCMGGK